MSEESEREKAAARSREYYAKMKASGHCIARGCGDPAKPGSVYCPMCLDKRRIQANARYAAKAALRPPKPDLSYGGRKAAGLCVVGGCKNRTDGETAYCEECLDKQRAKQKVMYAEKAAAKAIKDAENLAERKASGLCIDCGDERFSKLRCRRCYAIYLTNSKGWTRNRARQRAKLCAGCDTILTDTAVRCIPCEEKRQQRIVKRKMKRICVDCNNAEAIDRKIRCRECLDIAITREREKRERRKAAGLCPHCGTDKITKPGKSCNTCLVRLREKYNTRTRKLREEVLVAYGGACECCGETHEEFLQIDHIYNDGCDHRRELFGRNHGSIYTWLRLHGFPKDRFRLLCSNCNFARSKTSDGLCPHERDRQKAQKAQAT